jgi:hypothetical protein
MDSTARFSCQIVSAVFANCCFLATAMQHRRLYLFISNLKPDRPDFSKPRWILWVFCNNKKVIVSEADNHRYTYINGAEPMIERYSLYIYDSEKKIRTKNCFFLFFFFLSRLSRLLLCFNVSGR